MPRSEGKRVQLIEEWRVHFDEQNSLFGTWYLVS